MKTTHVLFLSIGLLLLSCQSKQDKKEITAQDMVIVEKTPANTDWKVLFDGTSFEHWRGYNDTEMPSEWSIDGDAMVFTPSGENGNNIVSEETYTNFVLSLEWKIAEGGNSGIFWGVHEAENLSEPYLTGPEIQVLDDAKHPDSFVGEGTHKAGSLYDMIAPSDLTVVNPAGEWNACEITIDHNKNQGMVTLNGTKIVSFPVHGANWDAMVANSKFADWEHFGMHQTGHIGLQDHGDKVWFRNIKIKRIN